MLKVLQLALLALVLVGRQGEVGGVTVHECEGNMLTIVCPIPTQQVILIRSAMYGRKTDNPKGVGKCGENRILTKNCERDVSSFFKFHCDGFPKCDITIDYATFGQEFCVDMIKYAQVEYDCVPKTDMNRYQSCVQKCNPAPVRHAVPHPFGVKPQRAVAKSPTPSTSLKTKPATPHAPAPAAPAASAASARTASRPNAASSSAPARPPLAMPVPGPRPPASRPAPPSMPAPGPRPPALPPHRPHPPATRPAPRPAHQPPPRPIHHPPPRPIHHPPPPPMPAPLPHPAALLPKSPSPSVAANPRAPTLPYESFSSSSSTALHGIQGNPVAPAPSKLPLNTAQSVALRASLLAKMQRIMLAIRSRRQG